MERRREREGGGGGEDVEREERNKCEEGWRMEEKERG